MKILEELEEARKAVSDLEGQELTNDLDTDTIIVKDEPVVEDEEVKEEAKDPPKEEAKDETKDEPKPEEKLEDKDYARIRRENAALKKKLEEKQAPKEEASEDNQEAINRVLVDVIQTVQEQKAEREFANLETSFAENNADYHDVSNQYKVALYQSLRLQNPRESHASLLEKTKKSLLIKAGTYMSEGLDPIQEMYEEAKSLGFKATPKQEEKEEVKEEKEIKPDMAKVAANRARNAGTVGAKGAGGNGTMTRAAAADMPVHEWAKLPAAEKKRLLGGG